MIISNISKAIEQLEDAIVLAKGNTEYIDRLGDIIALLNGLEADITNDGESE